MNVSCPSNGTLKCFPGVSCFQRRLLPPNSSFLTNPLPSEKDQINGILQVKQLLSPLNDKILINDYNTSYRKIYGTDIFSHNIGYSKTWRGR